MQSVARKMRCDFGILAVQEKHALVELARAAGRRRIVVAIQLVGPRQHHVRLRQLEETHFERREGKAVEFAAQPGIGLVENRRQICR